MLLYNHNEVSSYSNLPNYFRKTDVYPPGDSRYGQWWDMYSDIPLRSSTFSGLNREHAFPKSWWGGSTGTPAYVDLNHLYPAEAEANQKKSNYPLGEVQLPAPFDNSVTKVGYPVNGQGGGAKEVFEPADEYKGDFARTYFYMAAAYNNRISTWSSDMLAGNSYPAYKEWAVNLLLKWSRQDPVSDKETTRNDAVSLHQKNRNPFIDHPELAEYIWGNKKGVAWYANATAEPQIVQPAEGTLIDLGMTAVGVERSKNITVKGNALTSNVTATAQGAGFAVTPSSLAYDAVNNDGAALTVSYRSASTGDASGVLLLKSGDLSVAYTMVCSAVDGLPVAPATDITENSFVVRWSCIDSPDTDYTLDVRLDGSTITGFPRRLRAGDEMEFVGGLQPETTYTYTLNSPTLTSEVMTVTTSAPQPSIEFLYDGELTFSALPGEPSEIAEILIAIENITDDVTLTVKAPFQLSTDKSTWGTSVTLSPEEERFYMRLLSQSEGEYFSSVVAVAGDYRNDDLVVEGVVSENAGNFYEDFEPKGGATYNDKTYEGSACKWQTTAYFESSGSNAYPHEGEQAARMPKTGGHLTMLETKTGGMGTLSFWARVWSKETTTAEFEVKVSADNGASWQTVGTVSVPPTIVDGSNTYAEYSLPIKKAGSLRLKLEQSAGGRVMIDDLRISDYSSQSGVEAANAAEYHSWDAYCRNGSLIIESDGTCADRVEVYSVDGTEIYSAPISAGETALSPAPGLYIVVVRDFARRVLVK